jgi:hypothetical protein
MTRPTSATDFASDPLLPFFVLAKARCPQIIEGTEVRPKVRSANTPRVNAHMGRADNSSSGEWIAEEIADLE